MTHGYGAMPDYSAQLTPGGSLGGGGLHSRIAVEPGGDGEDVPAGVQVKSLKEIAEREAFAPEFAEPWTLPSTAVQAYPHDAKQGTPAMAPANPADPRSRFP
jgi:hypothetical protein